MKKLTFIARITLFILCLNIVSSIFQASIVRAQVVLNNYNSYSQNFNSLTTSTVQSAFLNNSTLAGWYLQHESYNLAFYGIAANDGTNTTRNFYSLGTVGSSDRALGGMATDVNTGSGYIGFRVRNNTGNTIRNFEISYTMEQWYNSGNEAQFDFSYTTKAPGVAITSLLESTSTWIHIDELDAVTPSTSSPIGAKNGNADVHRIVKRFTINEINLLPNQEIMLRWQYVTVNSTNGNGLAIDDVIVTPQINVFYAASNGDFDKVSTWARNKNGSGGNPTNFSLPNQVFHITTGGGRPLNAGMNMTGNNSKVVIGDGENPITVKVSSGSAFVGKIDVANHAILQIDNTTPPILGNLAENSTIIYGNDSQNNTQYLESPVYGNLKLEGKSKKVLSNHVFINGNLILDGSHLEIGNYNMSLQKLKTIQGGSDNGYVKTNGSGKLILTVPRNETEIFFPIGNSTYNPISLKQSTAGAEDEFRVHVIDGIYNNYDQNDGPTGNLIAERTINRTWLIEEFTPGGSNLTVNLFWKAAHELTGFNDDLAYMSHFENGSWDEVPYQNITSQNGFKVISRSGIQSFSPFGVFSYEGILPASFLEFSATGKKGGVHLLWKTSSETNTEKFTIESSADAIDFIAIGVTKASGNSMQIKSYSFVDDRVLAGERFYRIKKTDFDGKFSYSSIIKVKGPAQNLVLYPSPASDVITIKGSFGNFSELEITIMDMYGKRYKPNSIIIQSVNHVIIGIDHLPKNTYLLEIKGIEKSSIFRFIKI